MEKKIAYLTFFTALLCLLLLGFIAYNSSYNSQLLKIDVSKLTSRNEKITGPVGEQEAADMVEVYRNSVTFYKKTKLFWHRADSIKYYIDSIFIKFTNKIAPPEGYSWQVAFSPMFFNEKGKARITTCFLPVLADTINRKLAYDFFEEREKNSSIYINYFKPLYESIETHNRASGKMVKPGFIYDEGQLWP